MEESENSSFGSSLKEQKTKTVRKRKVLSEEEQKNDLLEKLKKKNERIEKARLAAEKIKEKIEKADKEFKEKIGECFLNTFGKELTFKEAELLIQKVNTLLEEEKLKEERSIENKEESTKGSHFYKNSLSNNDNDGNS